MKKKFNYLQLFFIIFISFTHFLQCSDDHSSTKLKPNNLLISESDTQESDLISQNDDASQDIDSRQYINEQISSNRSNAITRAVSTVSPAVVGTNVTQIRRYRQYSPLEDDPFWSCFFQPREYL